jgi:hypothetical protein
MESQLQALSSITDVEVVRTGSVGTGYTWTITFMEDGGDFLLAENTNTITSSSGSGATVSINKIADGEIYSSCDDDITITGLTQGVPYWARVFAYNTMGFGVSMTTSTSQRPIVVPGPPTSVAMTVVSGTELRVVYSPPDDDGGDSVSEYLIEWDTSANFDSNSGSAVTLNGKTITALGHTTRDYLSGGAPFDDIITGLTTGSTYYVRVYAYNSEGYGLYQVTSPTSEYPRELPSAPTGVVLGVTSETKLTVSFDQPTNIGGATITQYKIEWDQVATFDSIYLQSTLVDASLHKYHTINNLTPGQAYYVRVSAGNIVGFGSTQISSPASMVPAYQVPGKPTSLVVTPGDTELTVAFAYPRVPAHGLWCGGVTVPDLCPTGMGYDNGVTNGEADGGNQITKYVVEWDTVPTFDSGSSLPHAGDVDVSAHPTFSEPYSTVITSLTNGQTYYVRVLAYNNAVGGGEPCNRSADGTTGECTGSVVNGVPSQ